MTYDNLYRVTARKTYNLTTNELSGTQNFTYDSACNIIKSSDSDASTDMTYNANNMLLTAGNNSYSYDQDGNMTAGVIGSSDMAFEYDTNNRLVKANDTSYVYDAESLCDIVRDRVN